ncbi:MAG TPA: hypothetical protein VJI15_04525 [Candidatus Nanoarchaeia archaeon]|nr:hypothetical protein [Candidatus Nanoarchaeia archaeon]
MTNNEFIGRKISEAEKRIEELIDSGDLKRLDEQEKHKIARFYEQKSLQRLETAKLILKTSNEDKNYSDYSEVVSAAYYSMYYIIHSFVALHYKVKLREGLRGVHAITHHFVLYYLVKTKKLAKHLYEEYCTSLGAAAEIQGIDADDYQEAAFAYARKYQQQKENRERFTYFTTYHAESYHAKLSLGIAEEFVNTIRQLMI